MNRIRLVIFVLLGSLELEAAPGYSIRSWGLEEGLPSSQVVAIDQTSDGRLWLATSRGLCVYDGLVFENFTHAGHPELGTSDLQSMAVGPNDYVWFVDRSGRVGYFDGVAFRERPLSLLPAEDQVRDIVVSEEGLVLASTRNGALVELYPHSPTVLRRAREWFELERDFSPEIQMHFDSDSRLFAGLHTELIQWAPDGLVRVLPELHVDTSENRAWLWALGDASESGVWVAADLQIRRYAQGSWVENRGEFPWGDDSKITSLLQTREGVVWVGSHEHGLRGMRDASLPIVITREEGLPSDSVSSLFEDQEGNLWVGLDGGGIARIRSRLFENFGDGMGLGNVRVNSLVEDRTHDLWLATDGDGLIHWNGFAFRSVFRLDKPEVNVVLADSKGRVWAGTRDRGLHLVYPERTSDEGYKTEAALGFENGTIVSLYESLDGDIWVADERRVGRIDEADPHRAPVFPFEDLGGVRCMLEDSLGNLWLGTLGRGLYRWRAGQLDQFTLEEGLPDNSIVSMCRDNTGRVIVGTRGAGIFRINGAQFESLSDGGRAADSYVAGLANDHRGSLWLSTSRGISRIPWEDLDQNFTLQAGRLRRENYSKEDGLVSLEGQDRFHPSILVSELGKMYFPLKGGIAQIALDDLSSSQLWFPPVSIRSVVVDGSELPVFEDQGRMVAECYPGSRRIEIRFSGVGLSAPAKVIFRYRIEGEKGPWTSLGDAHSVSFLELDAGSYVIEVSAALQSGEWNPEPAKLLLKVLPYWWETVWAKTGALFAILALIVGAISLYARRRIRSEASQRELERAVHRERERIAQDMHDDLGARLTQLSFQGEMAKRSLTDEKSASGNLDRVVEGVRQTAQALDDIVWMTNPRNDTLSRLISHLAQVASELAESADWVLELSLPDSIPSQAVAGQLRHEIVMVFKEALNNASKHSECSRIRLNIHLDSNLLVFEVADDGKGFDVAGSRDRGNGLLQMKTRTERAGGQISWESQRGQGTRVRVKIQLSRPRSEGS